MRRLLLILLITALLMAACRLPEPLSAQIGDPSPIAYPLPQPGAPPSPAPASPLPYLPPTPPPVNPAPPTLPTYQLPSPSPTSSSSPSPTPAAYACLPEAFPPEYAPVLWVVDGNSIVVDLQGRRQVVRYLGIEAPRALSPSQPFGQEAKELNQALVTGQVVQLVRDVTDADRFGQLLRHVMVGDYYINYEMVRRGLAHANPLPPDLACQELLAGAQQQAQLAYAGLWALPTATRTAVDIGSLTPTLTRSPTPVPFTPATFTPTGTLTLTNTPTGTITPPTSTPTSSITPPTPTPTPNTVFIESIHYVDSSLNESGEYVQIRNGSPAPVNLEEWYLENTGTFRRYTFPAFTIQVNQACRIYTNESHPESCGFLFINSIPIWDNTQGCAALYRPESLVPVDEYCYP